MELKDQLEQFRKNMERLILILRIKLMLIKKKNYRDKIIMSYSTIKNKTNSLMM